MRNAPAATSHVVLRTRPAAAASDARGLLLLTGHFIPLVAQVLLDLLDFLLGLLLFRHKRRACGRIFAFGQLEDGQEWAAAGADLRRRIANTDRIGRAARPDLEDCRILVHAASAALGNVL